MATLQQINLVARDLDASVAFYRKLGIAIDAQAGAQHVSFKLGDLLVEFDTEAFALQWDTGWRPVPGGRITIGFAVASRDEVDSLYGRLVADGHGARQPPYDAFWGARYAIVEDPDGNGVGLMSPIEKARKFWPPAIPPRR